MSYRIAKRFRFDAAHSLLLVPNGHKCKRVHGHSYTVEIELSAAILNKSGMVRDYTDLHEIKNLIDLCLDHRDLNEVIGRVIGLETTAENLAWWLFQRAKVWYPEVTAVRVAETQDTYAEYRP